MKELIDCGLMAASDLRIKAGKKDEGDIDKMLRKLQGNMVTFKSSPIQEGSPEKIILEKFKSDAKNLLQPAPDDDLEVKHRSSVIRSPRR